MKRLCGIVSSPVFGFLLYIPTLIFFSDELWPGNRRWNKSISPWAAFSQNIYHNRRETRATFSLHEFLSLFWKNGTLTFLDPRSNHSYLPALDLRSHFITQVGKPWDRHYIVWLLFCVFCTVHRPLYYMTAEPHCILFQSCDTKWAHWAGDCWHT